VTEKYETLLAEQTAADKRDHEASFALLREETDTKLAEAREKYEALLSERNSLQKEHETATEQLLAQATEKYQVLHSEKLAADKDHEDAIVFLKHSLEDEHKRIMSELQSQCTELQEHLKKSDQEHSDAVALLQEELKAGHSNDFGALQQQLDLLQEQYDDLAKQKLVMGKAHEDAISELTAGMEKSTSDTLERLQNKHEDLLAHLETVRQHSTEHESLYKDLQSRHEQDVDAHAQEVGHLKEALNDTEVSRNQAIVAAQRAEQRIETLKAEVVRKHMAVVGPLEKQNATLRDKVERLEAMLAASDRITRAAASVGEKRDLHALAEEDEENEDSNTTALQRDTTAVDSEDKTLVDTPIPAAPAPPPPRNRETADVVGTVSCP
jgi:hypothetical protein